MLPFFDSTTLVDDPEALQARFHLDGYVFVRGQADTDALTDLRRQTTDIMTEAGWLDPDRDPMDAVATRVPTVEGEEDYHHVYDQIQALESFHAVAHQPGVTRVMQGLLGPTAFPHPLSIMRLVFPHNDDWATPAHQDHPNNQGTPDLYACWMPLADCAADAGALAILSGSHKLGLLPLEYSLGAGNRRAALDERVDDFDWVVSDFELGDMVVFSSLTLHRSLGNSTDRMRLSVDFRFQREHEPLTAGCLEPHFGRQTWDEIYEGWSDERLQYYWRDKSFPIVEWDASLHAIDDEQHDLGVEEKMRYNVARAQLARDHGWKSMPHIDKDYEDVRASLAAERETSLAAERETSRQGQ
ncbi:MAG: phytanoyl-CoA dioxygenase [Acidimicrobiales bacterium]|nr:phytanoyl-CoA dioxygenase [Acidimicrobiales bacterium]